MTHDEIEQLLGAYALDAVDPDERAEIEQHLATCPRCRAEVAAHREVASMLGNTLATDDGVPEAPAGLWDKIVGSLEEEPPELAPVVRPAFWRQRGPLLAVVTVAAALLIAVGVLSARVEDLNHQVNHLSGPALSSQVAAAFENPRHRTVALTSSSTHQVVAQVVVLPSGTSYFVGHALPVLGAGRTYQLWAISSGKVVSLGVLGRWPNEVATRVEATATRLMVTAEPTGGTPGPTTPVLMQGSVPGPV